MDYAIELVFAVMTVVIIVGFVVVMSGLMRSPWAHHSERRHLSRHVR